MPDGSSGLQTAHTFAAIAREVAAAGTVDSAAQTVLKYAVSMTGASWASLVRRSKSRVHVTHASESEFCSVLEQVHGLADVSPAAEALRERIVVRSDDLAADSRWSAYAQQVVTRTPIRTELVHPLHLDERDGGALVLWSPRPGFFAGDLGAVIGVYAEHVALALSAVRDHEQAVNLAAALDNSRDIGTAIGILMATRTLTRTDAFDLMKATSQRSHRKLSEIAAEVLDTGVLPA